MSCFNCLLKGFPLVNCKAFCLFVFYKGLWLDQVLIQLTHKHSGPELVQFICFKHPLKDVSWETCIIFVILAVSVVQTFLNP